MRTFFLLTLGAIVFLTGCASSASRGTRAVEVYTFKKERVDQAVSGNQGFLEGTPPASYDNTGRKRTLIGVDIELPSGSTSSSSYESTETTARETTTETTSRGTEVETKAKTYADDEWVK